MTRKLFRPRVKKSRPASRPRRRDKFRPWFELLEERTVLAGSITSILAAAQFGTPAIDLLASANARQPITIFGSGLDAATQAVFQTINQSGATATQNVLPTRVATDGTSMEVVVPDVARTGVVTLVSGTGSVTLQIVPTISDIDLTSADFSTGSAFTILGSGLIEGDMKIRFGAAEVVDSNISTGPNVFNALSVGAGADLADNDGVTLTVPAGASPGLITVETVGGTSAAMPISISQIASAAVSGTPASPSQPSANAGQTIRILGAGFDPTTDVIFSTIDVNGGLGNRTVQPDFVSANHTLMEVRVPDDAVTGSIRVIGAAGALQLQVVPTLKSVQVFGAPLLRFLGSGFTENTSLSVSFNGTVVADAGANIDVAAWFLGNDSIAVNLPGGATGPVTVTTAGGTSGPVNISSDDPGSIAGMLDVAVFPASAGADAGRLVVTDGTAIQVLEPTTLALVRTITRPGAATGQIGLDFLGESITVQDPAHGNPTVPAGTLIVINGTDNPDRLYFLNPAGAGTVLADVPLAGLPQVDEAGGVGIAYHSTRHTLFALRGDEITEINPATGQSMRSFHTGFGLTGSQGDITVRPGTGTLLVGGNVTRITEVDSQTGRVVGNYDPISNTQLGTLDVRQQGVGFQASATDLTGLAFDNSGQLRAVTNGGRVFTILLPSAPISFGQLGILTASLDGNAADALKPAANVGQSIRINGSNYNRFTEVEFPRVNVSGDPGFLRVRATSVTADGTAIEVVVPEEAVTGRVRVSGAPGDGLFLQIVPTLRTVIPADTAFLFDVPVEAQRLGLVGTGFTEGATKITIGGVQVNDNSVSAFTEIQANAFYQNAGLFVTIPERAMAGPVRVETAGGSFQVSSFPIQAQRSVGLTSIVATAGSGTPTNAALPAANAGQIITLNGYGFTTTTNIIFAGVSEDGTHGQIVVRPTLFGGGSQVTVAVPAMAVSGPVTVAGSATSFNLQVVPTLNGANLSSLSPGAALRLSGSGIPEGGTGLGESVTYTFGSASVTDTDGLTGPNVFSALDHALQIDLNIPASATGNVVTVTTAGGTATLRLADVVSTNTAVESQGVAAADGVGNTLAAATPVAVGPNSLATLTGRINAAVDIDVFLLADALPGGIVNLSATGAQGANARFRLFDQNGVQFLNPAQSIANFVLPQATAYYVGYTTSPNVNYNVVDGTGAVAGGTVGDYSLFVRYADPGVTGLNAIAATATSGVPGSASVASANVGQTITIQGESFTAATRVRFTTFNSDRPQDGLGEREIVPNSVAGNGLSLTVVVPTDAVTGPVRVSDEPAGLLLQIVPTLSDFNLSGTLFTDGATLTLAGTGLIEGAQSLVLGTAIGSGGSVEVQDLWDSAGPNTFNTNTVILNTNANFNLPINPPTGPIKISTLGGTSVAFPITFTGIGAVVAQRGTPANAALPSVNVRQAITLTGSGFNLLTQVIFPIQSSGGVEADLPSTRIVLPSQVSAGGTSLQVLVPDDATTGIIRIVGAEGTFPLQIVPTVVQVNSPATFATGQIMTILGSGFIENDVSIVLGGVTLLDAGSFLSPDVGNSSSIGAGLDRSDNDTISLTLPPGAGTSPLIVRTSGGEATLVAVNAIQGVALSGTPANAAVPSANPGQTIRILGDGINLTTQVIFPVIDINGNVSNTVLRPDLVSTDGKLAELRVPDDALTGNIQVVGAAGSFALQIVPTLKVAMRFSATDVRLLGGGFTENSSLSVKFGATVVGNPSNNLVGSSAFLANDTILLSQPGGSGNTVTVTTAGGTSAAVTIPVDDPASLGAIIDLAVFPPTAGADADLLVATDGTNIHVLDPVTLALVRTITRPGAAGQLALAFLGNAITVGAVTVPAGSLIVANATDQPDRLYYLNPSGSGTVLADVPLAGLPLTDESGVTAIAYHAGLQKIYVQRLNTDLITEINPATGAAVQSFHTGLAAQDAGLTERPGTGTLLVSDGGRIVEVDPVTGLVVGTFDYIANIQFGTVDLRQQGVYFQFTSSPTHDVKGLTFDNSGQLIGATGAGRIFRFSLPSGPTAILVDSTTAVAIDGTPANPALPSANTRQRIRIVGSGFNQFTEVEFPRVPSSGDLGFVRVRADVASADGTLLEVVIPDDAVTGLVKVSGAPGSGLFLQITPTIRNVLAADPIINFDNPVESLRWGLFGSGLVEGGTQVTFGGVVLSDNSAGADLDILGVSTAPYSRDNARLDLYIPKRALAGPVQVQTAGGTFQVDSIPILAQAAVGLTTISSVAGLGTPADGLQASANAGQLITLSGFGFTTASNILFQGAAEDGTRGQIVTRPIASGLTSTQMTVQVPAFAVTGPVTVAGSGTSVFLQVVPVLTGVSAASFTPGSALRLAGTGIPEGGAALGQEVTYTFGAASVTDISGTAGPDIFSALDPSEQINLVVPVGATGQTVTVTTLGGSSTFTLASMVTSSVTAEASGSATDVVGNTLASATDVPVGPNSQVSLSARINVAQDVDVYRLVGAEPGGLLTLSASGVQSPSGRFRLFDQAGVALSGVVSSLTNFTLPPAQSYYVGYSSFQNVTYNVVDGSGTINGTLGDYTLAIRYTDPGTTSLTGISTTAASGTPRSASIASANTAQTITLQGQGFTSATRVRFTTFDSNNPLNGLGEREVVPGSVAGNGLSLTVVVPSDAVTGSVRLTDEPGGLILQIVPTLSDFNVNTAFFIDGSTMSLVGTGFVEGAQTVYLGTTPIQDAWDVTGPNAFNQSTFNSGVTLALPASPPAAPITVQTLGGTSAAFPLNFTGVAPATVASQGTPTSAAFPSVNVRQGIRLLGSGFDSQTQVVFPVRGSGASDADLVFGRIVLPTQVAPDGTSILLQVPDDAVTGNLRIVGTSGAFFLQIVPTIVQVQTSSPFQTGINMTITGSGYVEGDVAMTVGNTTLLDTGFYFGPEVFDRSSISAGLDRSENDAVSFSLPPGASAGPITIRTAGGQITYPTIVTSLIGLSLAGTPANAAVASANPGQTIRLLGSGMSLLTEAIFPVIDVVGTISNRIVRPDLVRTDGTLAEIRVPDDALTGDVQIVGSPGLFRLQVVPTLKLAERFSATDVRLLGAGFTDDSALSVQFGSTNVADTGVNIDVFNSNTFLSNDTLLVSQPSGSGNTVTVTTAGGTSNPITIAVDDPPAVTTMTDLAVFPSTAGADAGRLIVSEPAAAGALRVLDPGTLAVVRTLARPGAASSQMGLAFTGATPILVQDAVRGNVSVPSGSLIVVNGADIPDRLYYLDPVAGTILADVPLGGPSLVDVQGVAGVAYHPSRGTLFVVRDSSSDLVSEINPSTGFAIKSFHLGFSIGAFVGDDNGDIVVHPTTGNLWVGSSGGRIAEVDPESGRVVGNFDFVGNAQLGTLAVGQFGVNFQSFGEVTGLAFDNAGQLLATLEGGRIVRLTLPGAPTSIQVDSAMAVALDGTPANPALPSANTRQRIRIVGSGYTKLTEVEFPRIPSTGATGFVRVRADVVSSDGSVLEVVVPDDAITGMIKVSGAPGSGLFLQVTPTIRSILTQDPVINFDNPIEGTRWGLLGSGLVEGDMRVTFGGIVVNEFSAGPDLDVLDIASSLYARSNSRLDLYVPKRALAGPVRVETAGGFFQVETIPIFAQPLVGLDSITALASSGSPASIGLASANTGQTITLTGFGFTGASNIIFNGVAEDGTRGPIVTRPVAVASSSQMTVVVPPLATTGNVTIAGSTTSIFLQIVPTLNGVGTNPITAGSPLRLSGTGIPEGGSGLGQGVTYTIGAEAITDTSGASGPNVFSALDTYLQVDLTVPGGATGQIITVTTAGGSASLTLADVANSSLAPEAQGAAATDGVTGILSTATDIPLGPFSQVTLTGRINTTDDVDMYRLFGAETGGLLSVSASGAQSSLARFRLFDQAGIPLTAVAASLANFVLPPAQAYYLGYSSNPNVNYNPVTGTGTTAGTNNGDYTLSFRYLDPATTSLNAITATATSGTPRTGNIPSANVGQTITLLGEGFTTATRVRFSAFDSNVPTSGVYDREVVPTVGGGGTSLTVVVPSDAVTGQVRLSDETTGLLLQIVPVLTDFNVSGIGFIDGVTLSLTGTGFIEGAHTVFIGASSVQDLWDATGPNVFNTSPPFVFNAGESLPLPLNPPTGPISVQTLGGTSATLPITFTGLASGTLAQRGTPAQAALPSTNVAQTLTFLGSGFDAQTQVIFPVQDSTSGDADVRSMRIVLPTSVDASGTSMQVLVPDDAATGDVRIVGAVGSYYLQIVPTILQIVTPATFATAQTLTIQGSGFIENDVTIGLGDTFLQDTGAFYGPDVTNPTITVNRADNDGITLQIPPGSVPGPWFVRTAGGTARFGVIVDLGTVIHEVRAGRTVAPGEQELFKSTSAVEGWLDFDVHYATGPATLVVLLADGLTPAPILESTLVGNDAHIRVATTAGQVYFLQVNGVGVTANYDLTAINHDRFDDPIGSQAGSFQGNYGTDPDGRNETAATATDFTPASYVNELRLTMWLGDTDWYTWKTQATGQMSIGAVYTPANGRLGFRAYADANANNILDPSEAAAPVATGALVADGTRVSGLAAALGQRFWVEVFSADGNSDSVLDKNVYSLTFSNFDRVDAGLYPGLPNNNTAANAVDLGLGVSWNSITVSDVLTIHDPADQDWFKLTTFVAGSLQVLIDMPSPQVGQVTVNAIDAVSGLPLSLLEFENLGTRLRFNFAPVAKNQQVRLQFSGQPNAYKFSVQNLDQTEPNPTMIQAANLGQVVHQRLLDRSLPGLPDVGARDEDWYKVVTAVTDGRLDVKVTPDATLSGNATVRIWSDANANQIPDAGELVSEGTSVGGSPITVTAPAGALQTFYVQVFDPASGPLTGLAYGITFDDVDRFDKASPTGAANNTSATATDLLAVVDTTIPGLTLLPLDADWFRATMRAKDGTLDVLVTATGAQTLAKIWKDTNSDGVPDTVVATKSGLNLALEDIPALKNEVFWVELALLDPTNLGSQGAIAQLQVRNHDRYDDPVADGVGGLVLNPNGVDPDGPNDGPRSGGVNIEGTLRLVQPSPTVPATLQGHIGVSSDGLGTFTTGNLQAEVPAGSIIEQAYLYVAARSLSGPYRPGQIGFEGNTVPLTYLPNVDNGLGVDFETARVNVTSIVAAKIGAAGGTFNFLVDETIANGGSDLNLNQGIEGTALIVLYSNPALPVRSVALLEGGLSGSAIQTTRLILGTPLDTSVPGFVAQLSLGIQFGFQPDGQYSTVNVNGQRLTSSAGNFNDGSANNGALVTVGGVGDSATNPADAFDSTNTSDDEFYTLTPFLNNGDKEIVLETANPTDNDSIFVAIVMLSGQVGVAPLFTDLGIIGHSTEVDLTLPQRDEDWYRVTAIGTGDLTATVNFASDGSASALVYRDNDQDGLPDDLIGDGAPDSVGTVTTASNQVRISNVPNVNTGDVFLVRVFAPTGQVQYDIDARVNRAPIATNDAYSVNEDNLLDVAAPGVLENDSDADADPITAVLIAGPSHGSLTLNPNGSFSYAPAPNFNGPDSFTYQVSDSFTTSNTAVVNLTVHAVNDLPVANPDSYSTSEDTQLTVAAPGVLGNDIEVDGDTLTAILVSNVAHGVLSLNANGSFVYTPATNYNGSDSFTYKADDGTSDSNIVVVNLSITATNDAPVANPDSYSTNEDAVLSIPAPGVLGNDSDADGNSLTAILLTDVAHGTLALSSNGSFVYTPAADYNGSDSFTYKANDGTADSNIVTVNISISAINDAPVANPDSYSTNEDTQLTIVAPGVLGNDNDVDGDSLTAILVANVAHGTLVLGSNGSFVYTPEANYNGPDSFTYKANDGATDSNVVTVSLTINAVNDAPVANPDSYSTNEDVVLSIPASGVIGNDTDADGNSLTAILVTDVTHGILALSSDGSFVYTPAANYNGSDSFTYKANDGTADSNVVTVNISISAINDAPVANPDSYSTSEDTQLTIAAPGVLGNDTDVDGNSLTAALVDNVSHGTLVLSSNGSFVYTPAANYNGSDSFTYKANDGTTDSNVVTVSLTINAVNDAPVASPDSYSTSEDVVLSIAAPGVIGNDTDADGNSLTAILVTDVEHGTLALSSNGSFVYTPAANYNGSDSFTYKANDGTADSNVVTVNISIGAINDAPVANPDSYSTSEDTQLTIAAPGVLGNDTDVDGNSLTAILVTDVEHGTLALSSNGSFAYTPEANYNGSDSFTYKASDGTIDSNVVTVNLTINSANDAPVANPDGYSTNEDTVLTIAVPGVLGNDTDVDGNSLTAILVTSASHGSLTLEGDGSFVYTPVSNYNGPDSFTYKANDGITDSNVVTVSLTITAVNDAPIANPDSYSTSEDTQLTIAAPGVLGNDTDVDGNTVIAILVTDVAHGVLALSANGSFVYAPAADYNGSDSFTYKTNDGTSDSNIVTVTLAINTDNDAPIANPDSYSTSEDTQLTVAAPGVLGNDTDSDGNLLTAILVADVTHGTLALSANGSFVYTPAANYNGPDAFTYKANDGFVDSAVVTVNLAVSAVNDAPVANPDSYGTNEDTPLSIPAPGVLSNDTDVDGDPLTAVLVSSVSHGILALSNNGSFNYTPAANYNGLDSFTYKANDGTADSAVVTVNLTVNAVNDAPVANPDTYSTNEDTVLTIAAPGVLANDNEADGNSLTAVLVGNVAHGTLAFNSNGSFVYTPAANYNGPDSFTYKANDGTADSAVVTVNITVNAVNDAPTANPDTYSTNEDNVLTIASPGVLTNDTDMDGNSLTALLVGNVAHGTLAFNSNGSFVYTPATNYNGSDSFTYKANDGTVDSAVVTVNLTVNAVNDAPVANPDTYTTNEDTVLTIAAPGVLANDTDVDGNPLTAVLVANVAHGTLSFNSNGSFVYTPAANYNGPDSFTYRANDGTADSAVVTVNLTVNAVNDAPVANPDSYTANQETTLTVAAPGVLANDTDVDGNPLTAVLSASPEQGTLTLNADGSFSYLPNAGFSGADSFTYVASDGTTQSAPITVAITVIPTSGGDQGSISGRKWSDLTGNGLTADDTPLGGVTINLYRDANANGILDTAIDVLAASTPTTAGTGAYAFSALGAAIYFVSEAVPSGWVQTGPVSGYYTVSLSAGANVTGKDFANFEMCLPGAVSNIKYLINGTSLVTDLRGNTNQGDQVQVTFTVTAGHTEELTLVSYTAPGSTFVPADAYKQEIFDVATGSFGPGTYSLTVSIPDSFYQIDFVCGPAIDQFGPAGSNIFYTPQGRLFSADNDGSVLPVADAVRINGRVVKDLTGDGYSGDDTSAAGVTTKLYRDANNNGTLEIGTDTFVASKTSFAGTGWYQFSNLPSAKYFVVETPPSGHVQMTPATPYYTVLPSHGPIAAGRNFANYLPPTKFYVVNDATTNQTFEYQSSGASVESYSLHSGNTAPRGAVSTSAGDKVWVIDVNRNVYVYNTSGGLLGSWTAGTMSTSASPEGIATNGTDVWIVDATSDKVYRYSNAASRLSGSQNAASTFNLNSGNLGPKDIVTDGTNLWVVNDSSTDKVFKYNLAGACLGSWTISTAGLSCPTGITLDPSNPNHLWIVDSGTDRVYQYNSAVTRTSGSQAAATSFALAAGNTNPQGIADPPAGGSSVSVVRDIVIGSASLPALAWLSAIPGSEHGQDLRTTHQAPDQTGLPRTLVAISNPPGLRPEAGGKVMTIAMESRATPLEEYDAALCSIADELERLSPTTLRRVRRT